MIAQPVAARTEVDCRMPGRALRVPHGGKAPSATRHAIGINLATLLRNAFGKRRARPILARKEQ
jgi:hypothetical protein